jgi:ATP-dependent exoDNAse (exonuclease V) beta subunit
MPSPAGGRPEDWQARETALDPERSFIVQAPAGSGKTELLTLRILTLLTRVERPEDILAITFTRKAAHEMRLRLLDTLQDAASGSTVTDSHKQAGRQLALQVLDRDRSRGWNLLQNPSRLQIQTIDSLCAALVRRMPWLSRFGATPEISADAGPLYLQAATRIVERIVAGGPGSGEVAVLLRHLDNRLEVLRDLLADMLSKRDQWLRHLLDQERSSAREILEQGLHSFIAAQLQTLLELLPPGLAQGLSETLAFAAGNLLAEGDSSLSWFLEQLQLPPAEPACLGHWLAIVELLLTRSGEVRKRPNKTQGFPADKSDSSRDMKQRFEALLAELADAPQLTCQLTRLRELPRPVYSEAEWQLIDALVRLLPLAVVELDAVFRSQGTTDFIAVAGAARLALGESDAPEELLLQLDSRLQHILFDEFQDTAYGQYVLLHQLISGWLAGDGRTLFLVGDPMQSIYRFREAEVGLFLRTRRSGIGQVRLEPLQLTANFRSDRELVDWFNRTFAGLFPAFEDEARGAVRFAPAIAARSARGGAPVSLLALPERDDRAEAAAVVNAVAVARAEQPQQKIAILVRSRSHATALVEALERANLRYQAREIVSLRQRSIIQDLLALTRALLHPGDRVAWLSLLRAPWCGLTLEDLLELVGDDARLPVLDLLLLPQQANLFHQLAPERQQRLQEVTSLLQEGLARRGRVGLRSLVESTWLSLAGPACCEAAELDDARQFFRLLERLDNGGELDSLDELDAALEGLFAAPDPQADERLQLMTIHKAKGLEFDTVILPGLGRSVRGRDKALLRWLEHPDHELLLAPIPAADGSGEGATYAAIGKLLQDKEALELIRLFYVAATRARQSLVLIGHLQPKTDGTCQPPAGSLLAAGWDALQTEFTAALVTPEPVAVTPAVRRLRRLPSGYKLPDWPEPPAFVLRQSRSASRLEPAPDEQLLRSQSSTARIVGEAVHAWFERHVGGQSAAGAEDLEATLLKQLRTRGITSQDLPACCTKALNCIHNALAGERGRWILQEYREQATELALTGLLDGQLVQAKIDRTFVDADNVRWVIDYKTSSPEPGQPLEEFYRLQGERYAPQLETYMRLLRHLEPERRMRMALYFPAFDGWRELNQHEYD